MPTRDETNLLRERYARNEHIEEHAVTIENKDSRDDRPSLIAREMEFLV